MGRIPQPTIFLNMSLMVDTYLSLFVRWEEVVSKSEDARASLGLRLSQQLDKNKVLPGRVPAYSKTKMFRGIAPCGELET
jgi:hypothetical protein